MIIVQRVCGRVCPGLTGNYWEGREKLKGPLRKDLEARLVRAREPLSSALGDTESNTL